MFSREMCVGMQKPDRSAATRISPGSSHKRAIEVYSSLYQKRICSGRPKEFRCSGLYRTFFEDHMLSLWKRQQLGHATMPFVGRRLIGEFEPRFQFRQNA